ncbi:MAG: hypothetical protein ABWZ98_15760 [Nakamurella sp.]
MARWRRTGSPASTTVRRRRSRLLAGSLLIVVLPLSACSSSQISPAEQPDRVHSAAGVPAADEQAIRLTIDRLNETAAGKVPDQQAALATAVEPGSTAALDDCPAATATLKFLPVYSALRATPEWAPDKGALTGTIYALPTLIRIYTGDRVTATDLSTLHFGVQSGEAFLTPLCVS